MTAIRKKKLKVTLPGSKPRNPLVAPAMQRKAGAHTPSKAQARQAAQKEIRQALREATKLQRAHRQSLKGLRDKDTE
jgi:hypothetical protein